MRIISLLPSATEIVDALGASDELVGVTHECDFPPAVQALPRVTSCAVDATASPATIDAQVRAITRVGDPLYTLDDRAIGALRPDVVLTQALCEVCAVMETDVRALAARLTPSPGVTALSATTLDGVFDDVTRAARAIGRDAAGVTVVNALRMRLAAIHDALKAARAPRPRVAVVEWSDPIFAGGHWVPEQVRRAGATDVLGIAGEHSRVVALDALIDADPEIVVIAPCGYSLTRAAAEARSLLTNPAWSFLLGKAVWALDANALTSRPGPRLVDGIEAMARIFNPALFSPVDPLRAMCVHEPTPVTAR